MVVAKYTERRVFERYSKSDNDHFVIADVTDEVLRDGVVIASNVHQVNVDELTLPDPDVWDERSLMSVTSCTTRRRDVK